MTIADLITAHLNTGKALADALKANGPRNQAAANGAVYVFSYDPQVWTGVGFAVVPSADAVATPAPAQPAPTAVS